MKIKTILLLLTIVVISSCTSDPELSKEQVLLNSINELLDDEGLRKEMGIAGRQRAGKIFSEAVQEKKLLDIYNTLLKT